MNLTLLPKVPSGSRLRQPRRFPGAFIGVCVLAAATAAKAEAGYIFTRIADTAGIFSSVGEPALNASGAAAFIATLDSGETGVFLGSGGAITTVTVAPIITAFGFPAINDAGTVAFNSSPISGNESVLAGNGGPLTTIADTAGQFRNFAGGYSTTAINAAGTVAFWASQDAGPSGIFQNSGGTIIPMLINSATLGSGFSFSLNDAGTLAFRGVKNSREGIFSFSPGTATTISDTLGPFNYFGSAPSINESGTVAFTAGIAGQDGGVFGIYTGNGGPLTTIADISGPFSSFSANDFTSNLPSINDSGTVAFLASLDVGGIGIYTGTGTDTQEVIGTGDPLFGSAVAALRIAPTSLNDSGQVGFYYRLTNGTTGIALATPVPEPAVSLLLALSLGLNLARRKTRKD